MRFYNVNKQKIINCKKYIIKKIELNIDNILSLSYFNYITEIKTQLLTQLNDINTNTKEPILFKIELNTRDDLDEYDVDHFYSCTSIILVDIIKTNEHRFNEDRLSADQTNINLPYSTLMKVVNYKTKYNCFNISFKYGNDIVFMIY